MLATCFFKNYRLLHCSTNNALPVCVSRAIASSGVGPNFSCSECKSRQDDDVFGIIICESHLKERHLYVRDLHHMALVKYLACPFQSFYPHGLHHLPLLQLLLRQLISTHNQHDLSRLQV